MRRRKKRIRAIFRLVCLTFVLIGLLVFANHISQLKLGNLTWKEAGSGIPAGYIVEADTSPDMPVLREGSELKEQIHKLAQADKDYAKIYEHYDEYPEALMLALSNNSEMLDFVKGYLTAEPVANGGLTHAEKKEDIPLLLQWDKRWGYEAYGDFNIALSGCGPTCLSMVLVALNHDYDMTPKKVADFAMKNGFYVEGTGTAWSLMTEGAKELGLSAKEVSLDEYVMKNQLDAGKMLICSVGPGDFTAQGHFIVIYDYDEHGFRINDPNCVYRSSKSWSYREIASQIKILWAYGKK